MDLCDKKLVHLLLECKCLSDRPTRSFDKIREHSFVS